MAPIVLEVNNLVTHFKTNEGTVHAVNGISFHVEEGVVTKWTVPEHYIFVDEIPRTSVVKIDKKELRKKYSTFLLDV